MVSFKGAGQWLESFIAVSANHNGKKASNDDKAEATEAKKICISPKQAGDPVEYFGKYWQHCTINKKSFQDGRIDVAAFCKDGERTDSQADIYLSGTYGPKGYKIDAQFIGLDRGQNANIKAILSGEYLGPCDGTEEN